MLLAGEADLHDSSECVLSITTFTFVACPKLTYRVRIVRDFEAASRAGYVCGVVYTYTCTPWSNGVVDTRTRQIGLAAKCDRAWSADVCGGKGGCEEEGDGAFCG